MVYYTNEMGGEFDNYEEARDATLEYFETEDLSEYLETCISFYALLEWAMKQPKFFDDFEDKITAAEDDFCNTYITEWEEEDEETEEE